MENVVFKIGDGGMPTEVFTSVGEVTTISGLRGGSAQVLDVSTLASTRREKIMGLPDEGQIMIGLNYDPGDTQQGALETARNNRALTNFQIALSDTPATVFSFTGYVPSFSVDAGIDTVVTGQVTVEITGEVTRGHPSSEDSRRGSEMEESKPTPGPWKAETGTGHHRQSVVITSDRMGPASPLAHVSDICDEAWPDANFIVAACNAFQSAAVRLGCDALELAERMQDGKIANTHFLVCTAQGSLDAGDLRGAHEALDHAVNQFKGE